ncbi:hypothetical protein F4X88_14085 [Candidatus Poribacteria bacterium]|nr:hypothetical protein [Candidatus Poribacteria bacterium]
MFIGNGGLGLYRDRRLRCVQRFHSGYVTLPCVALRLHSVLAFHAATFHCVLRQRYFCRMPIRPYVALASPFHCVWRAFDFCRVPDARFLAFCVPGGRMRCPFRLLFDVCRMLQHRVNNKVHAVLPQEVDKHTRSLSPTLHGIPPTFRHRLQAGIGHLKR